MNYGGGLGAKGTIQVRRVLPGPTDEREKQIDNCVSKGEFWDGDSRLGKR